MSAIQVERLAFNLECLISFASFSLYYYSTFKNRKSESKRNEERCPVQLRVSSTSFSYRNKESAECATRNDEKDTEMFQKLQLSLKRENCGTKFFRLLLRLHLTSFSCSSILSFITFLRVSLTVPRPSTLASHDVKKKTSRQKLFVSRTRRHLTNNTRTYGVRKKYRRIEFPFQ